MLAGFNFEQKLKEDRLEVVDFFLKLALHSLAQEPRLMEDVPEETSHKLVIGQFTNRFGTDNIIVLLPLHVLLDHLLCLVELVHGSELVCVMQ